MVRAALFAALGGLAYFGSARLGYALAVPQGVVTLWPPSGVMLGLLVLTHRRNWLGLVCGGLAGSFASDSLSGYSPGLGLAAALANSAESVLAASFIRWRTGAPVSLANLRTVAWLTIGAVLFTNAITACLGAAMLSQGFSFSYWEAWFVWWAGDGLGMLILAPLVIAWASPNDWTGSRILEAVILLAATLLAAELTLGPGRDWPVTPDAYLAVPLLIWVGVRLGPRGAATGTGPPSPPGTPRMGLGRSPDSAGPGPTSRCNCTAI
jgi:integral membrane sensor domain MASE1